MKEVTKKDMKKDKRFSFLQSHIQSHINDCCYTMAVIKDMI